MGTAEQEAQEWVDQSWKGTNTGISALAPKLRGSEARALESACWPRLGSDHTGWMRARFLSPPHLTQSHPIPTRPPRPLIPQASLCSCVPSVASVPTASSSHEPSSRAPPRLQSPGSPQHIHVLAKSTGGERERERGVVTSYILPTPRPQLSTVRGEDRALGKPQHQR